MRKELHVIKTLLTLLLIAFFNTIYCQKKLEGKYSALSYNQEHYNYFDFYKNGIFEYHSGASLGDDKFGKGHYMIKKDTLLLNYDLTELKENSYHKSRNYYNSKDSIEVKLTIYNFNRKPLSNVSVLGSIKDKYGVISSKEGIAYLKFQKEKGEKEINISDLCCGNYSILINTELNYEISIFLKETFNPIIAIKNSVIKYKVLEQTKNSLKLQTKEGSILHLKRKLE